MVSVVLYERFRGHALPNPKRVVLFLVFAFFITMIGYVALWLRGWEYQDWTLDRYSTMAGVSFVVKYMAISIVSAIMLPYAACLVIRGKVLVSADNKEDNEEESDDEVGE
jgi:hypothetical protein